MTNDEWIKLKEGALKGKLLHTLEDCDNLLADLYAYVSKDFEERIAEQRKRNLDLLDEAEEKKE